MAEPIEQTPPLAPAPASALPFVLPLLLVSGVLALLTGAVLLSQLGALDLGLRSPAKLFLLLTLAPVATVMLGVVAAVWPQAMTSGLLLACILLNEQIERVALPLAGFNLYPQDFLLAGAILAALVRARPADGTSRWAPTAVGKWIALALAVGTFQALRGMALGNEFNAAFGDWRRGYVYMIIYYLVLTEGADAKGRRWVHGAFVLGALLIAARGVHRLTLGRLFQMNWFDVFHVLSHGDLIFVIFLSYYCLVRVIYPFAQRRRWPWLALFPVTVALIVLGNFRASWIGFLLGGLFVALLMPKAKRRRLVLLAAPFLVLTAVGFYAMRNVRLGETGETIQSEITAKLRKMIDYETDPNIIWRMHSYSTAFSIWSEHPLLGAGLGKRLVFHSINATGQQTIHYNHRAHNSLLWVGFTTGALGLIVFLSLHATYFLGAVRRIRALGEQPAGGLLLAYVAFYVAFMTTALFDVVLEESATAIALYAHMAIVRRLGDAGVAERATS